MPTDICAHAVCFSFHQYAWCLCCMSDNKIIVCLFPIWIYSTGADYHCILRKALPFCNATPVLKKKKHHWAIIFHIFPSYYSAILYLIVLCCHRICLQSNYIFSNQLVLCLFIGLCGLVYMPLKIFIIPLKISCWFHHGSVFIMAFWHSTPLVYLWHTR